MPHVPRVEKLRVLYLNSGAEVGGAERSLLELLRVLPRDRFEAHLVLPRDGPLADSARRAGVTVHVEAWPRPLLRLGREKNLSNRLLLPLAPFLFAGVLFRLAGFVRRHGIHLVHANGSKAQLWSCAAPLAGVPVVWHVRDVLAAGPFRTAMRVAGRLVARRIICNSRASAFSISPGGPGGRVRVIYNGLDLGEFSPRPPDAPLRESLRLPREAFVIGTVGALSPLKGQLHLIRAMPHVLEEAGDAHLLIVGDEMYDTAGHRGYRRILEGETIKLGLGGRVVFAGRREDVSDLYNSMDLVVLASERPESFGRILVEAMACGKPVIATAIGGPVEIIGDSTCGVLVPPADPKAISAAILELYRDKERRSRMGREGRARVEERYTLDRHVAEIREVYEQVLSGGPPAS